MKNYLTPVVSIIGGILVLLWPAILNYVVGIYLIIFGILALTEKRG